MSDDCTSNRIARRRALRRVALTCAASTARRFGSLQAAGRVRLLLGVAALWLCAQSTLPASDAHLPAEEYIREFESSYHNVRTLKAEFTQTYSAWGRTRVESGTVYLARGGKMRWDYRQPESKLFISDGKELQLYVPAAKQLTRSSAKASEDVRVPLAVLLSRLNLRRAFAKVEPAAADGGTEPGDRLLRAYPKPQYGGEYREALIELTPAFDIRRLAVTYPDGSTMEFVFKGIERNESFAPAWFEFSPPPGTEIIQE